MPEIGRTPDPKGRNKKRLDCLLVERGSAPSREKAQALILAGKVRVQGQGSVKPGQLVPVDAHIEVEEAARYVSRAGVKLESALAHFHVLVQDRICMDIGTS